MPSLPIDRHWKDGWLLINKIDLILIAILLLERSIEECNKVNIGYV